MSEDKDSPFPITPGEDQAEGTSKPAEYRPDEVKPAPIPGEVEDDSAPVG